MSSCIFEQRMPWWAESCILHEIDYRKDTSKHSAARWYQAHSQYLTAPHFAVQEMSDMPGISGVPHFEHRRGGTGVVIDRPADKNTVRLSPYIGYRCPRAAKCSFKDHETGHSTTNPTLRCIKLWAYGRQHDQETSAHKRRLTQSDQFCSCGERDKMGTKG